MPGNTPANGPGSNPANSPRARIVIARLKTPKPPRSAVRSACASLATDIAQVTFGSSGEHWRLHKDSAGMPFLCMDGNRSEVQVSLSHCNGWIAAGLSQGCRIGIDIEGVRDRARKSKIAELLGWSELPTSTLDFWSRWTLWEAYAKCRKQSVLIGENRRVEALAAQRSMGKLVFEGQYGGLCDSIGHSLIFSIVIEQNPDPESRGQAAMIPSSVKQSIGYKECASL